MTVTLLASVLLGLMADDIDRQQLIHLIDAAQAANHRDVSFDYEGKWAFPSKSGQERVEQLYTGSFVHRGDGATLVDIYRFEPEDKQASHGVVAILSGTMTTSTRRADEKQASISIGKQGPLDYAVQGNYRRIWLADWVKKYAESNYIYEFEGIRQLDGAECVVVRFRLAYPETKQSKDEMVSELFWIDLQRGGHVVRFESRDPGDNLTGVTTVRLQRFEPKPGRVVWLPASGRVEVLIALSEDRKRPVYVTDPSNYETYALLPPTLRCDRDLKDDFFTVKPRTGDVVSDQVRRARYEFGQYMVRPATATRGPTDAETRAELDRMLNDSQVMANELKATSPDREGSRLWSVGPWVVAGGAAVGIGLLYRRRGGTSR